MDPQKLQPNEIARRGGSLITISFIGMGMADIRKAIPKLRLRLPPIKSLPIEEQACKSKPT